MPRLSPGRILPHRVDLRLQTAAGRKYTGRINAIIDKRKRRGLHMPSEMTARAGRCLVCQASAITRRSTERSQRARAGETSSLNMPGEIGKLTAKNCSRRSTSCSRCCRLRVANGRISPWCRYPSSRNCLFPLPPVHSLRQSLWFEAKPSLRRWHLSNGGRNQLRRTRIIRQTQPPRASTSRGQSARIPVGSISRSASIHQGLKRRRAPRAV